MYYINPIRFKMLQMKYSGKCTSGKFSKRLKNWNFLYVCNGSKIKYLTKNIKKMMFNIMRFGNVKKYYGIWTRIIFEILYFFFFAQHYNLFFILFFFTEVMLWLHYSQPCMARYWLLWVLHFQWQRLYPLIYRHHFTR